MQFIKSSHTGLRPCFGCLKLDLTDLLELLGLRSGIRHVSRQRQYLGAVSLAGPKEMGTIAGEARPEMGSLKRTQKRRRSDWDD